MKGRREESGREACRDGKAALVFCQGKRHPFSGANTIVKTFLSVFLVGCGSFMGGAARFLVSKGLSAGGGAGFPWATFAVNVAGCFLLGLAAGFAGRAGGIDPRLRLLLATGFCGGFTTFSTFMDENAAFLRSGHGTMIALYVAASLALGFAAVLLGHHLAK